MFSYTHFPSWWLHITDYPVDSGIAKLLQFQFPGKSHSLVEFSWGVPKTSPVSDRQVWFTLTSQCFAGERAACSQEQGLSLFKKFKLCTELIWLARRMEFYNRKLRRCLSFILPLFRSAVLEFPELHLHCNVRPFQPWSLLEQRFPNCGSEQMRDT